MDKRGQVTIFIVVAVVIVAIFLVFIVYPRVNVLTSELNPSTYLRDCIEPQLDRVLPTITKQGGDYVPNNYVTYQSTNIQYLCYISENYKPCIVQQPLLIAHVGEEIKKQIEPQARQCLADLKANYERRGYTVQGGNGWINVSIVPDNIKVEYDAPLTITKEGTQTFRKFSANKNSELYDLLSTATNIIQFESILGDSETLSYVQYYPDLKIEKLKKDGNTIYTLTNVVSKDSFTFATRSLVWPQGYGVKA